MTSTSQATAADRPADRRRRGFTLLELLIAIGVIAILAGILLPAVFGAKRGVDQARVVADIKDIESALLAFKDEYGVFPPGNMILPEQNSGWTDVSTVPAVGALTPAEQQAVQRAVNQTATYLNRLFPQWSPAGLPAGGSTDWNQNGVIDPDVIALTGTESMVFSLGGLRATLVPASSLADVPNTSAGDEGSWGHVGYGKSPLDPFATGQSNRKTRLIEFEASRLVDRDGDNMPEYVDPLPEQQAPYAYLAPLRGSFYATAGNDGVVGTRDDMTLPSPAGPGLAYYKGLQDLDDMTPGIQTAYPPAGVAYGDGRFQLISPGADGQFGIGGIYIADDSTPLPEIVVQQGGGPNFQRTSKESFSERDNITSFTGGTLQ